MEDTQSTIAILVLIAFIATLVAGASNKIVIYYDVKDFFVSFMPWGSLLAGVVLVNIFHEGSESVDFSNLSGKQAVAWYTCIIASMAFFAWSAKLSIAHNRSVILGVFVGIFKVLAALLGVAVLIGQIEKIFSRDSDIKDMAVAGIVIGIFVWLGKKLINGEQVYLAKGWQLPEREDIPAT